jgi:predicted acetylornithine/succinylornithine family transaminase
MATLTLPDALPAAQTEAQTDALLGLYKRAPMELVRGEGVRLFDAEGKSYLDFASGIAVNALGYGDPAFVAALVEAAHGLVHVSNLFRTGPGERLAARLVELSFAEKVFFCNSGAEANEGAFKFARKWGRTIGEGKTDILALRGSFHGRLFASLAATDRPGYRAPFRPLAGGVGIVERDIDDLSIALDRDAVCAVIVEPIQGVGGVRVMDHGFLRELRALTRERQVALIFDEIQCGLARTGHLFAYQGVGVEPDLLTLAKPLAGGLPMGAVLVNAEIAAVMSPGDHGTTFGGGPFVASAALHVVDRLSDPALLAHVRETGAWFGAELRSLAERSSVVREVRGAGLMWGMDVACPANDVVERARADGLIVITAGEHTVRMLPPLVITREELAEGLEVLAGILGARD